LEFLEEKKYVYICWHHFAF